MKHQLSVLFILFINAACQKQQADLNTVDNFANADGKGLKLNSCKSDQSERVYDDQLWAQDKTIDKEKVIDAWLDDASRWVFADDIKGQDLTEVRAIFREQLLLLPLPVGAALFQTPNLAIHIGRESLDICQKFKIDDGSSEVVTKSFSCWFGPQGESKGGLGFSGGEAKLTSSSSTVKITLEQAIRHSFMKQAMSLFINASAKTDTELGRAIKSKGDELVDAFLKDLGGSKSKFDNMPREKLRKELFVEVMDSKFCSKTTHETFEACFPLTYEAFTGKTATKRTCNRS